MKTHIGQYYLSQYVNNNLSQLDTHIPSCTTEH